jgi:hypothetical protein
VFSYLIAESFYQITKLALFSSILVKREKPTNDKPEFQY